MGRYRNEITTSKSQEEVKKITNNFLVNLGFQEKDYKGEKVWKKGMGILTMPQFIKVELSQGKILIEAWIKFAILLGVYIGELGLGGFTCIIPKRMLKSKVNDLEKQFLG